MDEDDGHHENGVHATKDSDRQQRLRLCVLNEILNTERDYVRTLLFLQSVSFDIASSGCVMFTFRFLIREHGTLCQKNNNPSPQIVRFSCVFHIKQSVHAVLGCC